MNIQVFYCKGDDMFNKLTFIKLSWVFNINNLTSKTKIKVEANENQIILNIVLQSKRLTIHRHYESQVSHIS